ncbi:MAG: MATE family efflux transporter [Christensenellaceae bacterium]|nr:MATE family efflux transporter [Christensenellaceae bacterium]
MMVAQLVNVLYNVVDRFFISRIPENATLSVTGLGLCLPIIMVVTAFANLFGQGGAPLFSIARGKGKDDEAGRIMGNAFALLVGTGLLLTALGLIFHRPLIMLFGGSADTLPYASGYLSIYLVGSLFVMISLGMNNFINAQGFAKKGMVTVLIGAGINILLDPLFIFVFDMGVQGAALATIIAQFVSAIWVLAFLVGKKPEIRLKAEHMRLSARRVGSIFSLGLSPFIMSMTNSLVQTVNNATLQAFGGDLYVGAMTIIGSVREIIMLPVSGITNSAQPVMGYNYGAKQYSRVRQAIRFMAIAGAVYTVVVWALVQLIPGIFIGLFNKDPILAQLTLQPMRVYYMGFVFMALQFAGQSTFLALGKARHAICFSLLRKVVIVVPLVLLLSGPVGMGAMGVFWAEPISDLLGGSASFVTMLLTVYLPMRKLTDVPRVEE